MMSKRDWRSLAEAAVVECLAHPLADSETVQVLERSYLQMLGRSHVDTVERVGARLDACGLERPRVLEIGAYYGVVSMALASGGALVTAQDRSELMLLSALRSRYEASGVSVSLVDDVSQPLPYADGTFDVLVCCEMLEHLPFNVVRLVKEFRRILRPGGFAFISVPNHASLKRRAQMLAGHSVRDAMSAWLASPNEDNWHWREYVEAELRELLAGTGFTHVETGYRHYVPPAHRNPVRRTLLNALYAVMPSLMDDLYAFAS